MTPCAKFVELYPNHEDSSGVRMVGAWVQGYLSAWNGRLQLDGKPLLKSVDPDIITLFIYRYCRDNPKKRLEAATFALIDDLSKPE